MDVDWSKPFFIVYEGAEPYGPYSYNDVEGFCKNGEITADTLVTQEGNESPVPVSDVIIDPDIILGMQSHQIQTDPETSAAASEIVEEVQEEVSQVTATPEPVVEKRKKPVIPDTDHKSFHINPDKAFYITNESGEPAGPYSNEELIYMHENGSIQGTTPVYQEGWSSQQTIAYVIRRIQRKPEPVAEDVEVNNDEFFYVIYNNKPSGPFDRGDLVEKYRKKELKDTTWVYQSSWNTQVPLKYIIRDIRDTKLHKLVRYYLYTMGTAATAAALALGIFISYSYMNKQMPRRVSTSNAIESSTSVENVDTIQQLKEKAEYGDFESQYILANHYLLGEGVPQNIKEAVNWYKKSANKGHSEAQKKLGILYDRGDGVKQDYEKAVKWYRMAANQGNANAQYNLGVMYSNGNGVEQSNQLAIEWYKKAADQGFDAAYYFLGALFYQTKDFENAVLWFKKAAEMEHPDAQFNLGAIYKNGYGVSKNIEEAVKWWELAAAQGNNRAQFNLGALYYVGDHLPQDFKKSAQLFSSASSQGNVNAQYNLGIMHMSGQGMPQNYTEAARQLRKAAEKGLASAQYMLGVLYLNGYGVSKSNSKARTWINKAADQGHEEAQMQLQKLASN